jgi:sugar lactone lactonase YvrE
MCAAVLSGTLQAVAQVQIGQGIAGDSEGPAHASQVRLNGPFDAAFDQAGNLYFSDTGNHKIRKRDARTQQVATIAGTGEAGFSGDNGPSTKARLNEPYGVTTDADGNVFFADRLNRRVRRIDAKSGLITTVAGTGAAVSSGDGGLAVEAGLIEPNGVDHDGRSTLYIADVAAHRIRAVNLLDGTVTTLAGDGQPVHSGDDGPASRASIHGARAVEVASNGHVFIVEREGNTVRAINPRTGLITTIAGKGSLGYGGDGRSAADATFRGPKEIDIAPNGDTYIVDTENHAVRRIDAKTGQITTIAGTGNAGRGDGKGGTPLELHRPHGVAVAPDGGVWVVDTGNHRLVRVPER